MTGPRDWAPEEPAGWLAPDDRAWKRYAESQRRSADHRSRRIRGGATRASRPWGFALLSFVVGIASIWVAISPVIKATGGGHGYVLSTVCVIAIVFGVTALRKNRLMPSTAVLAMTTVGIGAGVIGTLAMVGVAVTAPPVITANPLAGGVPAGVGPIGQTVPERTEVRLTSIAFTGAGPVSSVVVGNGGSVRLDAGYSVRSTSASPRVDVRLERRTAGGVWTDTGVKASAASGEPLTAATPSYSTSDTTETVQYRLASASSTTGPVSVVYENQNDYTGMAAAIYRYAAPYCPATAVHVATLGGREAGDYAPGTLLIRVDSRVGVSVNLPLTSQRALALHECSHERQWLNYGGTHDGNQRMLAAAAALFTEGDNGAPPMEHAADCGAMAIEPNGYLGYGGYCTSQELDAAARLLEGQLY